MVKVEAATSEANLNRFLVEHTTDVLLAVRADGTIEHASASAEKVLGLSPRQLAGMDLAALVHPDDRAPAEGALTHAQWSNDVASTDVRVENRRSGDMTEVSMMVRRIASTVDRPRLHVTLADRTTQRRIEVALRASERRFRGLTSQTRELVAEVDLSGTITYISSSLVAVLGHHDTAVVGRPITDFIHPDDFPDLLRHFLGHESADPQRHRAIHADGSYRWLETLAQIMIDDDGHRSSVLLSSRDITDRLQLESYLERERQLLTAIVDNVHAGVIAVDDHGTVLRANSAFCQLFGTEFVPGRSMVSYLATHQLLDSDGEAVAIADRPLEIVLKGGAVNDRMFLVGSADGNQYEVVANATPIIGSDGSITAAVLTYEDVTALRSAQHELRRLATIDTLTDLPNRRHLVAHLEDAMRRNARSPERLAVLFADLDGFKAVNDDLGHEAGDELLRAAGRRLRQWVRDGDVLARYGGDEFVVVIEGEDARREGERIAKRIEYEMSRSFALAATTVKIGCSVGIAEVQATDTLALVLAKADAAMYQRKSDRRAAEGHDQHADRPLSRL